MRACRRILVREGGDGRRGRPCCLVLLLLLAPPPPPSTPLSPSLSPPSLSRGEGKRERPRREGDRGRQEQRMVSGGRAGVSGGCRGDSFMVWVQLSSQPSHPNLSGVARAPRRPAVCLQRRAARSAAPPCFFSACETAWGHRPATDAAVEGWADGGRERETAQVRPALTNPGEDGGWPLAASSYPPCFHFASWQLAAGAAPPPLTCCCCSLAVVGLASVIRVGSDGSPLKLLDRRPRFNF